MGSGSWLQRLMASTCARNDSALSRPHRLSILCLPSALRHVCKSLSSALQTLSDHFTLVLSCWNQPDSNVGLVSGRVSLKVDELLSSLESPIALLRLEFSSSVFGSQTLAQVNSICQEMNWALGRLLYLSVSLPVELQDRLAHLAGIIDYHNIGDTMAILSMVEQALRTGNASPERLR